MKTLSLYVYNKDTHRTVISASPDGDRIRKLFSLLLDRYLMAWAITFVLTSYGLTKVLQTPILQYY